MRDLTKLTAKSLAALSVPKKGRVNVVKEALASGLLADPAFTIPLVEALSDSSAVFADVLADEILQQIGESLVEPLLSGMDGLPEPVRCRRLRVIRRFAPEAAKVCARKFAHARHTGLSVECIDILSGSEADAPLLMDLARSRSEKRSFSAYRALAGISNASVREFLRDSLVRGVGFPQLSIAYHPDPSLCATASELISNRVQRLEAGEIPSEADSGHLITLVESIVGQNCDQLDDLLNRCLGFAVSIQGRYDPYVGLVRGFTEATCEAIATNPVRVSRRSLVEQRGRLIGSYHIYAMYAAASLGDCPIFEEFAPTLLEHNIRGRCRSWQCSSRWRPWPCSIVSAVEYVIGLKRGLKVNGQPLPQQSVLIEQIRNDPRWEAVLENLGPSK